MPVLKDMEIPIERLATLEQELGITKSQATILYRWFVAQRTAELCRNSSTEDALREARHDMKFAFPESRQRSDVQEVIKKLFG